MASFVVLQIASIGTTSLPYLRSSLCFTFFLVNEHELVFIAIHVVISCPQVEIGFRRFTSPLVNFSFQQFLIIASILAGTDCSCYVASQILSAWAISAVGPCRFLLGCFTSEHFFLLVLFQTFPHHLWTSYIFAYQLTDLVSDLWMYGAACCSSLANRMCFMSCAKGKLEIVPRNLLSCLPICLSFLNCLDLCQARSPLVLRYNQ